MAPSLQTPAPSGSPPSLHLRREARPSVVPGALLPGGRRARLHGDTELRVVPRREGALPRPPSQQRSRLPPGGARGSSLPPTVATPSLPSAAAPDLVVVTLPAKSRQTSPFPTANGRGSPPRQQTGAAPWQRGEEESPHRLSRPPPAAVANPSRAGPASAPAVLLPATSLSLQIRRGEGAGNPLVLWWPAAATGGLLPAAGSSTSVSSAGLPDVNIARLPPSSQGWRERSGCSRGEDTSAAEERWLSSFPVANGTVEACLQVCGAGHSPASLPFRSFYSYAVRLALEQLQQLPYPLPNRKK
jgi:hypothetical protein